VSIEVLYIAVLFGHLLPVLIILPVSLRFKEAESVTFKEPGTGVTCAMETLISKRENSNKIILIK
jgi:hypothetical protein